MVSTAPINVLKNSFPVHEFRFKSKQDVQFTDGPGIWSDISGLILEFAPGDAGNFLVTLNLPNLGTGGNFDVIVRLILRVRDTNQPPGVLIQTEVMDPGRPFPVTLVSEAEVVPTSNGSQIVAQWQAGAHGSALIPANSFCSLSAVGSLTPSKVAYSDENHFEYPELFSRGLRLNNYSEVLFLTGYSATAAIRPLEFKGVENIVLDAGGQMQWIVDHLDEFFKTIPYADGSGVYSKNDIVYFDLVIDKTVSATEQTAVLKVLEKWFAEVDPKPSTGILKKIEALAFASTKVEIEFILAH